MAPQGKGQTSAQAELSATEGSILDRIITEGKLGQTPDEQNQAKLWLEALVKNVIDKKMVFKKDTDIALNERITAIDEAISKQLNEVMHAEPFQKLEATWRGLHYLLSKTEVSTTLKIKVLNVTKNELLKDFQKASDFDKSNIFEKIHDEGYGVLGGDPYGVLIGDFEFGRHPQDLELLEHMSHVAAISHAPFISAVGSSMFNWESFTELAGPRDLATLFDNDNYVRWKSFRESDDSKYVGLCMPHILMRLPYGKDTVPVEAFNFEENVDGSDHKKYLWGNAAYAFATRLTEAFAKYEWCAAIRGVEGGGLVEGLPAHTFKTDDGDIALKCPTEIAITDRRENELAKLGFIPLCHYKGKDQAAFIGAQSCQKAQVYLDNDATANARLTSQLQYTMAITRFAHFLKAIMRDKVGSFMSRDNCEKFLNTWISNYVLLDDSGSQDAKAKFPLRDAQIKVEEVKGKPGVYNAVAHLRPHFQLDELAVSLRLVAQIPKGKV